MLKHNLHDCRRQMPLLRPPNRQHASNPVVVDDLKVDRQGGDEEYAQTSMTRLALKVSVLVKEGIDLVPRRSDGGPIICV